MKICAHFIITVSIILFLGGCNSYSKLLKSDDYDLKYQKAQEFYNEKEYYKAFTLLDELMTVYNGTNKAENIYWLISWCDYHLKDYRLAATRFDIFYKRYPLSTHREEALFMKAMSNYKNSPDISLDQSDTKNAINDLQLFVDKFPQSTRVDSCNQLIESLLDKLEEKKYNFAYLYYNTSSYKAAIIAFDNLLEDFPDTKFKEKALFYQLSARYLLAQNSIASKKRERFQAVIESYTKFVDLYSSSTQLKKAEDYYLKAKDYMNQNRSKDGS